MNVSNRKYLYIQVYNDLKEKIASGAYAPGDLLPSEREIGDIYQVDRTTVRKALDQLVQDSLVEKKAGVGTRVIQADIIPKAPVSNDRHLLAFFLPESTRRSNRITQPFYASLFYNMERECRELGYTLVYSTLNADDDFAQILHNTHYDGIIFVSNVERKFINYALGCDIPCVLANEEYAPILSVVSDNFGGMTAGMEHLLSLGHTNFGIIKGIPGYATTRERFNACSIALQQAGLDIRDQCIAESIWDADSGYEATKQIFRTAKELPTALVAFNDSSAMGALQAAHEFGLRVPEDLSVLGFDDIDQTQYTVPPLTTVRQHMDIMAKVSLQNLMLQIKEPNGTYNIKITVPTTFMARNSTAPPRHLKK